MVVPYYEPIITALTCVDAVKQETTLVPVSEFNTPVHGTMPAHKACPCVGRGEPRCYYTAREGEKEFRRQCVLRSPFSKSRIARFTVFPQTTKRAASDEVGRGPPLVDVLHVPRVAGANVSINEQLNGQGPPGGRDSVRSLFRESSPICGRDYRGPWI